jgi:hypothetical protein
MRLMIPLVCVVLVACSTPDGPIEFNFATVEIRGVVTSAVDGTPISWVYVAGYDEVDETYEYPWDHTDQFGRYELEITCIDRSDLDGGTHYVQAKCIANDSFTNCEGWQESEPVYISSRCPASGETRSEVIDFELDPTP